jgi:hypothetical protein
MMDSASIVITALIVTIVLQIVLIILVLGLKKKKTSEPREEKPEVPEQRDFRRQKEAENRFARKSPQEHRPKPAPAQGQNIDKLESSLRDINLRLKNADKDQEKERQRIKDTISSSSPRRFDNQKPRERGDHFRRNDRPRQDYQQNRSADSPRGPREERFPPKNQFEARERKPSTNYQNPSPAAAPAAAAAPIAPPSEVPAPIVQKTPELVFESSPALTETRESLQHGRKFPVKRRVLNVEEEQANGQGESAVQDAGINQSSGSSEKPSPEPAGEPNLETKEMKVPEPSAESDEPYAAGPISFGR